MSTQDTLPEFEVTSMSPATTLQCQGVAMDSCAPPLPMNTMPQFSALPQFLQPQAPQMCFQPQTAQMSSGGGCAPMLIPAGMVPDGMMMMACVPVGMNSQQGSQAASHSNMMGGIANGMQACMVPMAYN